MIKLDKEWGLGADNIQWIVFRKTDPKKTPKMSRNAPTKTGKWKPTYFFPRIEQAITSIVTQVLWADKLRSFAETHKKQQDLYEDIINKLNITKESINGSQDRSEDS